MTTKTELILKKLLDEKIENYNNSLNDRIGGVFFYGFIIGVIMSYSGFLSYFSGIGTGIIIATKYKFISHQISEKTMYIFNNIINQVKNT